MSLLLLIVVVVLLFGAWPSWGWHTYGFAPSGILGIALIVLLILLLTGRL